MLVSTRRELRHGAIECFSVICSYFHDYRPMDLLGIETNLSIKNLFGSIEKVSQEASIALRFRLQRNLLPSLTDEGNVTPGLVCDANTSNDPDGKFIISGRTQPPSSAPATNRIQAQTSNATNNDSVSALEKKIPFSFE